MNTLQLELKQYTTKISSMIQHKSETEKYFKVTICVTKNKCRAMARKFN